jgi:glycosyltransferase involved in cell wall biosynthesis
MAIASRRDYASGERSNPDALVQGPLLSVVIVVFRDKDELGHLIESILLHKNEDLEIVVIDGGSADGTTELLQAFGPQIDYWISEPDKGIYDAMNKGLKAASGDYILHLNAGDRLRAVPWDALRMHAQANVDVVCCRVQIDGEVEYISRTSLLSKIDNTWHHQGTFYRRVAHLGYDITYRTHGDFDHNQRILRAGLLVKCEPCIVAEHQSGGLSMGGDSGRRETYRSVRTNFGWHYLMLAWLRFQLRDVRDWIRARRRTPLR